MRKARWPKNLKAGEIVHLRWLDHASGPHGWEDLEEGVAVFDVCFVETIGFVMYDGEDVLKVAHTMQRDGKVFTGTMNIVKSCVTEIKRLKVR